MRIELKDIKKGDIFYETDYGNVAMCRALENSREVNEGMRKGWVCRIEALQVNGKNILGDPYEIFECHEPNGYGLKLYNENPYV